MSPVQTDISDIVAKYWVISLGKHSFCMMVGHLLKLQLAAGFSPKREQTQSLNSAPAVTFSLFVILYKLDIWCYGLAATLLQTLNADKQATKQTKAPHVRWW